MNPEKMDPTPDGSTPPADRQAETGPAAPPELRCAIITVSDTRSIETDTSGGDMETLLRRASHKVAEHTVTPVEPGRLSLILRHWLASDVNVVLVNGGTRTGEKEGAIEVVRRFLDREYPAFAPIFSMLSYREVGAPAVLTRAVAGVAEGKLVVALPGARWAVRIGMEKLVIPELAVLAADAAGNGAGGPKDGSGT